MITRPVRFGNDADTPPKTDMEPENERLEEENSYSKPSFFFRFHVSFRGG